MRRVTVTGAVKVRQNQEDFDHPALRKVINFVRMRRNPTQCSDVNCNFSVHQ